MKNFYDFKYESISNVLPAPPPNKNTFSKQPNTITAFFIFLHGMMDRPQKDPLLYSASDVGRFMNTGDVDKNTSASARSVQYVCPVLTKTEIVKTISYTKNKGK
jgi:hypothetical protein